MGGFYIESNTGKEYLGFLFFNGSDSKWLLEILIDEPTLPVCAEVLQLDLSPLKKIVTDWYPTDEILGEQTWEEFEEAAWQSPDELIQCIDRLVDALDSKADVYIQLEKARQREGLEFLNLSGFTDEAMLQGFFQEELRSLRSVIALAQKEGATSVRLAGS